jgi:hypothetical protein
MLIDLKYMQSIIDHNHSISLDFQQQKNVAKNLEISGERF